MRRAFVPGRYETGRWFATRFRSTSLRRPHGCLQPRAPGPCARAAVASYRSGNDAIPAAGASGSSREMWHRHGARATGVVQRALKRLGGTSPSSSAPDVVLGEVSFVASGLAARHPGLAQDAPYVPLQDLPRLVKSNVRLAGQHGVSLTQRVLAFILRGTYFSLREALVPRSRPAMSACETRYARPRRWSQFPTSPAARTPLMSAGGPKRQVQAHACDSPLCQALLGALRLVCAW
ncbi:hypothetical protein AURDEDRAFT_187356 [Auricularia subglabra TFB-10046 SS5]|nr:hypothetical protein AURDEDRAFT_187356 [Auricularia subglabra TFB-10046 SS5]